MSQHAVYTLTETSPSAAGTTAGTKLATSLDDYDCITVYLTLRGATGGTLNVTIQRSPDGTTFYDWFRSSDITAAAAASSMTLCPVLDGTPTVVGTGTTPALAKGTVAPGLWGKQMRVVFEAGSGTSAGASQTVLIECHKA